MQIYPKISCLIKKHLSLVNIKKFFRMKESNVLADLQKCEPGKPGNPNLVLRAQPTVDGILKEWSTNNQVK